MWINAGLQGASILIDCRGRNSLSGDMRDIRDLTFAAIVGIAVGALSAPGAAQDVPSNARATPADVGECDRGFQRSRGRCVPLQIPDNAELNSAGYDWECIRGFLRNRGRCVAVQLPENAELNSIGTDWACKRGFLKGRGKCVAIQIPDNAELNSIGNGWECRRGFQNSRGRCVAVRSLYQPAGGSGASS